MVFTAIVLTVESKQTNKKIKELDMPVSGRLAAPFSHKFRKCREHGDLLKSRNDSWNCLAFLSKQNTLKRLE